MDTMIFTILHYEHNGSTLRPDQRVMNFTCLVEGQFLLDDALQWTKTNGKWSPERSRSPKNKFLCCTYVEFDYPTPMGNENYQITTLYQFILSLLYLIFLYNDNYKLLIKIQIYIYIYICRKNKLCQQMMTYYIGKKPKKYL